MNNAAAIFNTQAEAYNDARRRLIPPYDSFYGTAVEAVGLAGSVERILDLGAGTGLLSAQLRAAYPHAYLTLTDAAAAMLDRARATLGSQGVSFVTADLADDVPTGPWDAIVSALAIHHLDDAGKQELFSKIRGELRTGGVFVNAEQVAGPSENLTGLYAEWHERRARAAGSSDEEWAGAKQRMAYDQCASVENQLSWLRAAGFEDVDCLFKDHRFAVMVAR